MCCITCFKENYLLYLKISYFFSDVSARNETEVGDSRRWSSISVISRKFDKSENGKILRCLALHEAFPSRTREVEAKLNVLYAPEIKVERPKGLDRLEADVDSVNVTCR